MVLPYSTYQLYCWSCGSLVLTSAATYSFVRIPARLEVAFAGFPDGGPKLESS